MNYEVKEYEGFLRFRLYRLNINQLSGEAKLQLATTLNTVLNNVQGRGVPIYTQVLPGYSWRDQPDES